VDEQEAIGGAGESLTQRQIGPESFLQRRAQALRHAGGRAPEAIERIRFLRASGMTLAAICERLAAEGYKPRADGGRWHERQIARILERVSPK